MISPYDMGAKAAAAALEARVRAFEINGAGLERDLAGEIAALLAGVLEANESYELGFADGYAEAQAEAAAGAVNLKAEPAAVLVSLPAPDPGERR